MTHATLPDTAHHLTVMISAGEASGDQHAAEVLLQLKQRHPTLRAFGLGGPALSAAGMRCDVNSEEVAVMGITEVLLRYRQLNGCLQQLIRLLEKHRPQLLLTVDFPDFNLKLAKAAKALNIPVLHYISPKVWAWRPKRIHTIAARVDRMALIFPFEQPLYQAVGLPATYVGNPLKDQVTRHTDFTAFCQQYQLDPQQPIVSLVPGSRRSEVTRLLPLMLQAAEQLRQHKPDLQFTLPLASTIPMTLIDSHHALERLSVRVIAHENHRVMSHADALLIASGTATLEAAIIGTPMCVVYKISAISHFLVKRLIQIPWVSLVNIVAQRPVVNELLQADARPDKMAAEVLRLLDDQDYRETMKRDLHAVDQALGEPGAAKRLSDLVEQMLIESKAV